MVANLHLNDFCAACSRRSLHDPDRCPASAALPSKALQVATVSGISSGAPRATAEDDAIRMDCQNILCTHIVRHDNQITAAHVKFTDHRKLCSDIHHDNLLPTGWNRERLHCRYCLYTIIRQLAFPQLLHNRFHIGIRICHDCLASTMISDLSCNFTRINIRNSRNALQLHKGIECHITAKVARCSQYSLTTKPNIFGEILSKSSRLMPQFPMAG